MSTTKPFSINVLPPKEFNKLPYDDVDISFGLADRKKGKVFVKKSGIPALDLLNIGHEIHEMVSKISPHEENGIRYKKGGAARSVLPLVLGSIIGIFNPILGAVVGGLMGGGMGAYAGSRHPDQLGGAGRAGLLGGITGALGAYGGGQLLSGGIAGGTAASPGFLSKAAGIGQGALFGTAGSGASATSLLGHGGRSVGLFGPGTLLGSSGAIGGTTLGKLGTSVLSSVGGSLLQGTPPPPPETPSFYLNAPGSAPQLSSQVNLPPAVAATRGAIPTTSEYIPAAFYGPGPRTPYQESEAAQNVLTFNPSKIYRRFSFV